MKPPWFEYHRPETVSEVLQLLSEYGEDCRLLAGGQSLVPILNLRMARPAVLIDLNRCGELGYIERCSSAVVCGPMTRQIDAQNSPDFIQYCTLVPQCLDHGGPIAIRNRGTIGGIIAHADRSAELPAVAVALDATMVIEGVGGRRNVSAQEFFLGDLSTAVNPDEMLREISFPIQDEDCRSTFVESGNRQRDMAVAGVACQLSFVGDRCRTARLAVIGVEEAPVRLSEVEAAITSANLNASLIVEAGRIASEAVNPDSDVHASADYRRHLVGNLVSKAIVEISATFANNGESR